MSGIYIHIPFCKQACFYCDFHFSTQLQHRQRMVDAICQEIALRQEYLPEKKANTLYLGGGSPSILDDRELNTLLETIHTHYTLDQGTEITLEANPDDLVPAKLKALQQAGINRLSIGIQSFDDAQLTFMNRAHNAREAERCVKLAQDAGITNLSIDLIYGIPSPDHSLWQQDLDKAIALGTQHISAYCLTIEPKTVFGNRLNKGQLNRPDEEYAAQQFEILVSYLAQHGYEQYEISNFAKAGYYSKHNTSYWQNKPYIGFGPSAHSFNLHSRQYNVAHNHQYMQALEQGNLPFTLEELSLADRVNEYLMTSLRTIWGCNTQMLKQHLGVDLLAYHKALLQQYTLQGFLQVKENTIYLTGTGKLLADKITAELMYE
jgi:oxygen-independent coproporphyrinogen III oxidase